MREFARGEVAPRAAEIDQTADFPKDVVAKCAEMGYMGVGVSEEHGGAGLDTVSYALIIEELSAACATTVVSPRPTMPISAATSQEREIQVNPTSWAISAMRAWRASTHDAR